MTWAAALALVFAVAGLGWAYLLATDLREGDRRGLRPRMVLATAGVAYCTAVVVGLVFVVGVR